MSAWWPLHAAHATRRASRKTGRKTATSLFWLPPENTSLCRITSPSWTSSPKNAATCSHAGWSANASTGMYSVCSSMRPRASYRSVTTSRASLRIGERVVRSSVSPICSVIDFSRRCSTEARIGSTSLLMQPPWPCGPPDPQRGQACARHGPSAGTGQVRAHSPRGGRGPRLHARLRGHGRPEEASRLARPRPARPSAFGAAVRRSSLLLARPVLQPEPALRVDREGPAGGDEDRRRHLLDDRRPLQSVAVAQAVAVVDRGVGVRAGVGLEHRATCLARVRRVVALERLIGLRRLVGLARCGQTQADDLDRRRLVAQRVAVEPVVAFVKRLPDRVPRPRAQLLRAHRDADLVVLAAITQVEGVREPPPLRRDRFGV